MRFILDPQMWTCLGMSVFFRSVKNNNLNHVVTTDIQKLHAVADLSDGVRDWQSSFFIGKFVIFIWKIDKK